MDSLDILELIKNVDDDIFDLMKAHGECPDYDTRMCISRNIKNLQMEKRELENEVLGKENYAD